MMFSATAIPGVMLADMEPYHDDRGFFARTFCPQEFSTAGIPFHIAQVNISQNIKPFTLRGLHWEAAPQTEAKIVSVMRGRIFDVAVDLRKSSQSYRQWVGFELCAGAGQSLHIPAGCAHGFLTLEPASEVIYFMNKIYAPGHARGALWNDAAFNIGWPALPEVVGVKDKSWPPFDVAQDGLE